MGNAEQGHQSRGNLPEDGDHDHHDDGAAEYDRNHWATTNDDYVAFNYHNGYRHYHLSGGAFYDHNRAARLTNYDITGGNDYGSGGDNYDPIVQSGDTWQDPALDC